jgi:peptide/nickel transport system permease protein
VIVVLSIFPGSMLAAMVALGVLAAPGLMRVVRSAAQAVRESLYVAAAQVAGLSRTYIVTRHVLPRIAGAVTVQASFLAAVALTVQTGLAFLGLLVAAPAPSWGGMVADGVSVIVSNAWLIWPPGIAIGLTILALSLLGDAVRDATAERWSPSPVGRRRGGRKAGHTTGHRALRRPLHPIAPRTDEVRQIGPDVVRPESLLSVEGLCVGVPVGTSSTRLIDDVSFEIIRGETVGIVGETGSGKTITATAILGLLAGSARIEQGRVMFAGRDLAALSEAELRRVRGRQIAFISQEPMISLDPAFRVGHQLRETVRHHRRVSRSEAARVALELLGSVHLPDPEAVFRAYPHELSGGMAQRVAIARALAGEPALLIADEPTTALDVTVQAEVLELLRELQSSRGMAILLVTHDWGVVADICDRVVVMYAGQVVELSDITSTFESPLHPYTEALLASNPHKATDLDSRTLPTLPGAVLSPGSWPNGCHFAPRCQYAVDACRAQPVVMQWMDPSWGARCIRLGERVQP